MKKIFALCIEGYGSSQIARILTEEEVPTPTAYARANGRSFNQSNARTNRWSSKTIVGILERIEYVGHTVNFKTHTKSYKHKKRIKNSITEWQIFENTHEAIISKEDFDLVQELRKNKRKIQKCEEVNPFSGMVYCADCGAKMYLCRARTLADDQEHLKCATYSADKDDCSAHFIRTVVLKEIVLAEINKVLERVHCNEEKFIQSATELSVT